MKTTTLGIVGILVLAGIACRGTADDDDRQDDGGGGEADAIAEAEDGGVDEGGGTDGEVLTDADGETTPDVVEDAEAEAEAEADAAPVCACPALPTACAAPAADLPTFTPPGDDVLEQLFGLVACADTSLRLAIYQGDWDCLVDTLLEKMDADTDIVLEIVTDDDACPRGTDGVLTCGLAALEAHARVTIHQDARSGLMHHKFLVADDARVWVASANFTRNSFCTDWNNAIVVDQTEIVGAYLAVFQRLFVDGQFGPQTPADPVPTGGAYTVYVSPESPTSSPPLWFNEIVTAMGAATTSIEIMLNAWTRTEMSVAAIAAHGRGVAVRAVVHDMYLDDAPAQAMLAAGIEVRAGHCHSKVMVVDDALVVTGSANWSENAWSNNENSLWIRDAAVAAAYDAEFELVWAEASPPAP